MKIIVSNKPIPDSVREISRKVSWFISEQTGYRMDEGWVSGYAEVFASKEGAGDAIESLLAVAFWVTPDPDHQNHDYADALEAASKKREEIGKVVREITLEISDISVAGDTDESKLQ